MKNLTMIIQELTARPLLVLPDYAEALFAAIKDRAGLDIEAFENPQQFAAREGRGSSAEDPWLARSMAYIPVMGSLTHRGGSLDAMSGMTSYKYLESQLDAAIANPSVHAIMMEFDTPGGSVSGAFDFAEKLRAASAQKTIVAFGDGLVASAGYLLASQCSYVFSSQTSLVGSIGVVMSHVDRSKKLEAEGLNVSFIFAGDHKVDGNSAQPLPDDVRKRMQADVNASYEKFLNAVGAGRGDKLDAKGARATKAALLSAEVAVEKSLTDGIMTFEAAVDFTERQANMRKINVW
jgi:signal peptide peptidase SppA